MERDASSLRDIAHWIQFPALALLVGIADHGSLSAGARAVGMAQPNATRALKTLERRLGYPLVTRRTTGSTLTAEGVLTVQWAREVMQSLEAFASGVRSLADAGSAALDFGASMTVAEYLAPEWISALHRKLPAVTPRMRIMNSQDVIRAIQGGELDFGFVETPHIPLGLNSRRVYSDEMLVVTAPDHAWAVRGTPVTLHELQTTALIEREEGSGTRAFLDYIAHVDRPAPVAEINSNATICQFVAAGLGPAVLSQLAVETQLKLGNLVEIPFNGPALVRELHAIWTNGHVPGPNEAALMNIAAASMPR